MASNKSGSVLLRIALLLVAFGLGAVTRQLMFDIEVKSPVPTTIDPVKVLVQSSRQVSETRDRLIRYLFDRAELPAGLPTDNGDGTYTVQMQNGLQSLVRLLAPDLPNGRLVLYHAGHAAFGTADQQMVDALVANGYTVLIFDMPLIGVNAMPVRIELPNGPVAISRHDHMAYLDPITDGSPVRYFVEPIVTMLNLFDREYADISMVGLSGGGWTTTEAAAIDPRIDRSYPVAGTLPLAVKFAREDSWGDWEQTVSSLYAIADYQDLYVLGAYQRRQLQVLNEHDPCCFGGDYRPIYLAQVQAALMAAGGGSFDVFLDEQNRQHSISRLAIAAIVSDIESSSAN